MRGRAAVPVSSRSAPPRDAGKWDWPAPTSHVFRRVLDVVDGRLADPPRRGRGPFTLNIQKMVVLMAAAMVLVLCARCGGVRRAAGLGEAVPAAAGRRGARRAHGRRPRPSRRHQHRVPDGDVAPVGRHRASCCSALRGRHRHDARQSCGRSSRCSRVARRRGRCCADDQWRGCRPAAPERPGAAVRDGAPRRSRRGPRLFEGPSCAAGRSGSRPVPRWRRSSPRPRHSSIDSRPIRSLSVRPALDLGVGWL